MKKLKACLIILCLMLTACNSIEIYTNLSEEQANLMLSTLLKRGIEAEKISLGKTGYAVTVDANQMVQALEILNENSLPQEDFQNLGSVFSGQSMIASANEEKSRLAYAISQELSETFSHIDGVLNARVHLVLADIDTINDKVTEASAAVFLRHTTDSPVVNMVSKIKEITAGSVADLKVENVAVMLVPSRDIVTVPTLATNQSNTFFTSTGKLNFSFITLAAAFALIFNMIILSIQFLYRKKKNKDQKEDNV